MVQHGFPHLWNMKMNRSTLKEVVVRVFSAQKALKEIKPSNCHLSGYPLGFHLQTQYRYFFALFFGFHNRVKLVTTKNRLLLWTKNIAEIILLARPTVDENSLPSFKPRGAGYESVYYGINNTRPIYGSQNEHIEISNILKFSVGPVLNDTQPFKNSKFY